MLIGALILGILGGIFGLLIGLFGYTLGGITGSGGLQALSMAIPIASVVGGGMAKAKPIIAGSLMILSSIGMFALFGFNFFTAIPLVLSGVGGVLAVASLAEAKQVALPQSVPLPASVRAPAPTPPSPAQPAPPPSPAQSAPPSSPAQSAPPSSPAQPTPPPSPAQSAPPSSPGEPAPSPPSPVAGVVGDPLAVRGRGSGLAWNRFVPIGLLVTVLLLAVAAVMTQVDWGKRIPTGVSPNPSVPSIMTPPRVANAPSFVSPPPVANAPSAASPPPVTNPFSGRQPLPNQIPVGVTEQVGPSFECRAAKQPLAQMLCADAELSRVDLRFAQAYWALLSQVGDSGSRDLKQEDLRFLDAVQQQCGIPHSGPVLAQTEVTRNCVKNAYEAQRAVWILRLTVPFSQEANRRIERHIALQRALQQLGFLPADSAIDGVYGAGTREAISQWQQSQNLKATGVLSDTDAAALEQQTSAHDRAPGTTEVPASGRMLSTANEALQTSVAQSAPEMRSQTSLALVPLKYCGEYVRDGDPKACYDAPRGAEYTRKWYIRPGTTAALPWFPEGNARIVYMRSFGNDHIFLEGCGHRVDVNLDVPNNGFPISCPNVTVSSSTGQYLYISSSVQ